MTWQDALRMRNPELYQAAKTPEQTTSGAGSTPTQLLGVEQVANTVESFMPAIERITGLNRKDIFLQLLKSGFKGNMNGFLDGLMGRQPEKPSKFEKYIKTSAIWIPVGVALFVLLVGGVFVVIVFLWKVVATL